MCFTMGMSALLGTFAFGWAAYEWRNFRCLQYSLGMGYWGIMEWIQAIQHFYAAGPEDNYAMCSNVVNQRLTEMGLAHITLQPLFLSMGLMSMYRRHDFAARVEADLIFKLCLFGGVWFVSYALTCALFGWEQTWIPVATEECPNFMWLHEGYDGRLGVKTPNIDHKPCTYYAPTKTGHLAWAVPIFKQTYFVPGNSMHFFLMFAPYFVMFKRQLVQLSAVFLCLTGPVLTSYLTASANEQPAIWCLFSVCQTTLFSVVIRWKELYKQNIPDQIHHPGWFGEQPLTYYANKKQV